MSNVREIDYAVALHRAGHLDQAEAAYRRILARDGEVPGVVQLLGVIAHQRRQFDRALALIGRAIELAPDVPHFHYNLGEVYRALDRPEQAAGCYRRAIALNPRFVEAIDNLAAVLLRADRLDEALETCRRSLELHPAGPEAHLTRACINLKLGRFVEGWRDYEWRIKCRDYPPDSRTFAGPLWHGEDIAGRTLYVHAEQGFGDTIQFMRYVPMLARYRARVVFECPPGLLRLARSMGGDAQIIARGAKVPPYDLHAYLLSLPGIFGTTPDSIPARVPYLHPEPAEVESLRSRIAQYPGRRIGIAWAGNPAAGMGRFCPLERLLSLRQAPGVRLFSLQKGPGAAEVQRLTATDTVCLLPDDADFATTAAIMASLDLVVCVDTAVAHLAGAMGRPVWVLLSHGADWRWMVGRSDSPWYPTMRLFRQRAPGDWQAVIEDVMRELGRAA